MPRHYVGLPRKRLRLTKKEFEELQGLHDVIEHVACFGSRDVLRAGWLEYRASDAQLLKICQVHYQDSI